MAKRIKRVGIVAAAVLLALAFTACAGVSKAASYKAGTYTGVAKGHNGDVKVEVVVSDSAILSVKVVENVETQGIADGALSTIPSEIVKNQSLAVDTVSGATVASRAVIDAAAQALKSAGADVKALSAKKGKAAKTAAKTYDCDVVVVGGGGAGLSATLAALEADYKVILMEKLSYTGGGYNYAEGTFGMNSSIQKAAGVHLDPETMFKQTMEFHHWLANAALVKAFYAKSGDTIEWLIAHGVKFRGVITANPPDGNIAWHLFAGGRAGRPAVETLTKLISDNPNGTILYNTPGKKLVIENGSVVGVEGVAADGSKVVVRARAVILATGGFSSNEELKQKYLRFPGYVNVGAGGREGDGIHMLEQVDAQLVSMTAVLGAGLVMPIPISQQMGPETKYPGILGAIYNEGLLTLSPQGKRFMNERLPIEFRSNATEQVGGNAYVVFDQKTVDEFMNSGQRFGFGVPRKLPDLQAGLDKALAEKNDWCFKSDTLENLAAATGMDAATLKSSVGDMNGYVRAKSDPEYYLEPKALFSIEKAPFYAVRVVLGMYATVGGARVTEGLQVVNKSGSIVPGLYAIGLDAGGLYGDTYDMRIANGAASAFSITSGRLAVENIRTWVK